MVSSYPCCRILLLYCSLIVVFQLTVHAQSAKDSALYYHKQTADSVRSLPDSAIRYTQQLLQYQKQRTVKGFTSALHAKFSDSIPKKDSLLAKLPHFEKDSIRSKADSALEKAKSLIQHTLLNIHHK